MMNLLSLAGIDVPVSRLVLGTMTFGDTVDASGAAHLLDLALEAGVTGVDTANVYANGVTEEIVGGLLVGRRDRIVLATKAGMPHPDHGDDAPLSAAGLRAGLEGSLRRLKVEHVDLFYLHQPDRRTPLRETLATVADLTVEGKIRALGVSNFAAWQIVEINHVVEEVGAPRPVIAQQVYNLLARRLEEEYREFARTSGLVTMVYNPLAGGLLTGRHQLSENPSTGRFGDSMLASMYRQRYWAPELFAAVTELARIAAASGIDLVQLSLRWLLGREGVDALLLGASREEHLRANLAAAQAGALPGDVVAACDVVGARLRGPMPAYNR